MTVKNTLFREKKNCKRSQEEIRETCVCMTVYTCVIIQIFESAMWQRTVTINPTNTT